MLKAARPGQAAICVLAALLLTVAEATAPQPRPLLLGVALLLLAYGARGVPRVVAVLAALAWTAQVAARVHGHLEAGSRAGRVEAELSERLERLERRKQELVDLVQSAAAQAAELPAMRAALSGDPHAVPRAFLALEDVRGDLSPDEGIPRPALALHVRGRVLAWSGRTNEPPMPADPQPARSAVYVLDGTVSTTLVAVAPVRGDAAATPVVTSAMALAARRNIRNEFLRDFDHLAGSDPGLEIRYVDVRARPEEVEGFPPLDPALQGREAVLRAPSGHALALVRVTAPRRPQPSQELELRYRRVLSSLVLLALLAWGMGGAVAHRGWRALVALTVARGALLYLRPPWPGPGSVLLSPEVYASDALARSLPALGALLRSPLDLLLTAAWLLCVAVLGVSAAARAVPRRPSLPRTLAAGVLSLPVVAGAFFLLADAVANSSLDLETLPLLPRSAGHLVMQAALLLVLGAAALLVAALFTLTGPWPRRRREVAAFAAAALAPALLALRTYPTGFSGAPLLPALGLLALAALAGARAQDLGRWMGRVGAGAHAGLAIAATGALAAVLYPSLVRFSDRNTRQQVEQRYAREVAAQPEVRRFVLSDAEHRVDALRLLEETPPSLRRGGLEELAFFAWSSTELALRGVSSAIEIQDASGAPMSRFALNLPSLSSLPLPANEEWKEDTLVTELGGSARTVLHARRLLTYHGAVHGAVHVMVADDFWNLPFLRGRDPYSELFRTRPARDRPVEFLAWDPEGALTFSSAERPPPLPAEARDRARGGPFWTSMELDGRPHDAYVFATARGIDALAVPSLTRAAYAASLVEAVAAMTLLALLVVMVVVLVRTALRRQTLTASSLVRAAGRRFVRRLLVAFLAVAVCPVVVMQVLVHRFVDGRLREEFIEQARERAEVARKVARDYVHFLRREQGPGRPLTDDPLVWIADTVGNDVDVFEQGRLLASSKREIYDAGLLPRRASGAVYREVILQGLPFYVRNERIGAFTYSVASVPLQLDEGAEPWILSLPLVLPQRDVQATVADIERRVRLASVVFFVLAAGLAHSMARRISGPISSLTEATRRIAQGDLDARVAPTSGDELRHLVEGFNQMACELETQRRDLERSNRLAAWAEMARQVAHEVKNPLTPIQLSAEHLRRVWHDGDRQADFGATLEACTGAILEQVRSLRGIVTEFSAFARPPATVLSPQDPAALLEEIVRPYQAALPEGVLLTLDCAPAPPVRADRRLLERAIVNLIENALQAVAQSGRIAVRLRFPSPERVEIEVADSGPGLDPEVRDRIFEPFFSTKTAGSGLGLALVKKTAEDHGGGVHLESEPGKGTRAILWLPSAPEGARSTPAPAAEPAEATTARER